jgi:pimeloyl-ACP methyl ester carboxylesterase
LGLQTIDDSGACILWHGEFDTLTTPDMAEYLARQLPRAKFYRVGGAGHLLTEHPDVIKQMRAALHAEAV